MRRRHASLAALALLAGTAVCSQPARAVPRIGVLMPTPPGVGDGALGALRRGMAEHGLAEGRDYAFEVRWNTPVSRLGAQIAELLALPVDLIVAGTSGAAAVARGLTRSVPIVMAVSGDPVALGLVASLARPGGNVTGMSLLIPEVVPRRIQLLAEAVPGLRHIGMVADTDLPHWRGELRQHEAAAQARGMQLTPVEVAGGAGGFERELAAARRGGIGALVLMQSANFATHAQRLAALALDLRLPSIAGPGYDYARAGGLMHYGPSIDASWHRSGSFVQRILAGAKPGELPVELPSRFELGINLRTASALGLAVPEHLLLLADEVIR